MELKLFKGQEISSSNREKRHWRSTEEFFSLCMDSAAGDFKARLLKLIRDGVDWEILSRLACEKGIAFLLYQSLKFYKPSNTIEKKTLNRLKISYLSTLAQNSYYQEELKRILGTFMKEGIAIIPLKGITLSQRLYGNITSRDKSVDFDLLIKEEDKEKARLLLENLGYDVSSPNTIKEWEWFWVFSKPKAKMIELHWDITMMVRRQERIKGLWQGAKLVDWEGIKYYDFKAEELLLQLSVHLVNSDSFRQLRYICDINQLIKKYDKEINWERLIEKAKKWRLSSSLYTALKLNKDFFGLKFPKEILSKLKVSLPKRLFIGTFANKSVILKGGLRRKILDEFLGNIFLELIEAATFGDYLAIFRRVVLPPKEVIGNKNNFVRIIKGISRLLFQLCA